jgi:type IV pilus assembly protein PilB
LDKLGALADERGQALEEVLLSEEIFTRRQLLQVLENQTFCPSIDLEEATPAWDALRWLPEESALRWRVLPLSVTDEELHVAIEWPDDRRTIQQLQAATQRRIVPHVGLGHEIQRAITEHYRALQDAAELIESEEVVVTPTVDRVAGRKELELSKGFEKARRWESETNVPALIDAILEEAAAVGATDVHLQPQENGLWCRFRVDGVLQNVACLPLAMAAAVTSRVKIMGDMDIAEHRLPQDGRCHIDAAGKSLDLRISVMPSQWGEKVVTRILQRDLRLLHLEELNMPPGVREPFQEVLDSPQGFYLVTGPTGSGKTTTLYATLTEFERGALNISTLEDPIEYSLAGISQMQVKDDIGFGFSEGLRALLRQDPDVILVGEIRDVKTVDVACRAALTGHKVLSTIHTNDACQAITRLLEMGTEPYLISATLRGVLAQRLVRKICPDCVEEYEMSDLERVLLGYPDESVIKRGRGCRKCNDTGYRGRQGIFEYFHVDDAIHNLIQNDASPHAIRYAARKAGMVSMADFARRAVLDGVTTVAEIQRVILSDEAREQLCTNCQRVVDLEFTVCPYCHEHLKKECPSCSRSVESNWEACAHCGEPLEQEWEKVFCKSCLAPVRPEWEQCKYCGTELGS